MEYKSAILFTFPHHVPKIMYKRKFIKFSLIIYKEKKIRENQQIIKLVNCYER